MARATFMHDLWSYGSLVIEWPFLPWGLGGESSCCKSGLLHSVKTPAASCTWVIFLEKKEGKWQTLFLISVTVSRLKFLMYLLFSFLSRVFTSNYLLKLRYTHTCILTHTKQKGRNSPYPLTTLISCFQVFSRWRQRFNYLPWTEGLQADYWC